MAKYEYQILHQLASRAEHMNRQLNSEVEEGWEPVSLTGDQNVIIMMRRAKQAAPGDAPPQAGSGS